MPRIIETAEERRAYEARLRAAINARPICTIDIAPVPGYPQHEKMGDHWYWCRQHLRAEHSGWAMGGCVRIGPFVTEREANRLEGVSTLDVVDGEWVDIPPLGMDVES
jgi:hypothetical protein